MKNGGFAGLYPLVMSKYVKIAIAHGPVEISRNSEFSQLDSMVMFHRFLFSLNITRGNFSERHGQIMENAGRWWIFQCLMSPERSQMCRFRRFSMELWFPAYPENPKNGPLGPRLGWLC